MPLRTNKHEFDLRYGNYTKLTEKGGHFRKPQIKVLTTLFATMLIVCGKVNFTNLSRYSQLSEKTYRRQFNKPFDFGKFNREVIQAAIPQSHRMIAVMDCSFIAKRPLDSISFTLFTQGRVEKGLEVSLVAVVDVETETDYAMLAEQTFAQQEFPALTRMDYYLLHLETIRPQLPSSVRYLAVDGYYAKEPFVTGACTLNLHVISKLRCDAKKALCLHRETKTTGSQT